MAYIGGGWDWSVTFRDNNKNPSTIGGYLPAANTLAQAEDFMAGLITALTTLTSAAVLAYTLTRGYRNDAPITPAPESEVERKLSLMWSDATGRYLQSMSIPSPVFTVEVDDTDVVPTSSAALAALIAVMTNGPAGGGNGPTTYAGTDIVKLASAEITHRKRKKQRK